MGGIGPALGALLARALAMAADCPGGIGSALGSTAEALLARLLALYPKRWVNWGLSCILRSFRGFLVFGLWDIQWFYKI